MAPITVGEKIPDGDLAYLTTDGVEKFPVHESLKGKKVVLFAVPGAFTPTCSLKHVPSFLDKASELKSKGVDLILCISVNDPFVVKEWEKTYPNADQIKFLADGSARFTKALCLDLDLTDKGLGIRSQRYCLLIEDLVVKVANIEKSGYELSSAEEILKSL